MVHNVAESYLHRALVHTQFPPLDLTSTLLIVIQEKNRLFIIVDTLLLYSCNSQKTFCLTLVHNKLPVVTSVIISLWGHSKLKSDGHYCHNSTFLKFVFLLSKTQYAWLPLYCICLPFTKKESCYHKAACWEHLHLGRDWPFSC